MDNIGFIAVAAAVVFFIVLLAVSYVKAAKMDLQLQVAKVYCEQLPEIAKGISEAYAKVGNITMYGDQSAAIASGVIDKTAQLSDGLAKGLGIDLKSLLAGALGAKILEKKQET